MIRALLLVSVIAAITLTAGCAVPDRCSCCHFSSSLSPDPANLSQRKIAAFPPILPFARGGNEA